MGFTIYAYVGFLNAIMTGTDFDAENDTIKVSLHTSTYAPDLETHDFFDDVTDEVANGSGYVTGGATLAASTITPNASGIIWDADDTTWIALNRTFRYAVVRKDTGVSSTSLLLLLVEWDSNRSPAGSDFTIEWPNVANGGLLQMSS